MNSAMGHKICVRMCGKYIRYLDLVSDKSTCILHRKSVHTAYYETGVIVGADSVGNKTGPVESRFPWGASEHTVALVA